MNKLTAEEKAFIQTLYGNEVEEDQPTPDCLDCGQQISSVRQHEYPGAIFCTECAERVSE